MTNERLPSRFRLPTTRCHVTHRARTAFSRRPSLKNSAARGRAWTRCAHGRGRPRQDDLDASLCTAARARAPHRLPVRHGEHRGIGLPQPRLRAGHTQVRRDALWRQLKHEIRKLFDEHSVVPILVIDEAQHLSDHVCCSLLAIFRGQVFRRQATVVKLGITTRLRRSICMSSLRSTVLRCQS